MGLSPRVMKHFATSGRRPGQCDTLTDSKQAAVGPEVKIAMGSKPLGPISIVVYVDDCNITEHLQHITKKWAAVYYEVCHVRISYLCIAALSRNKKKTSPRRKQ